MRNTPLIVVLMFVGSLIAGCNAPSLLITPVPSGTEIQEVQVTEGGSAFGPKVALIEVEGMLVNARVGGFLQAQENKLSLFTQQMEQAEKDPKVKAVVLRVN